MERNLFGEPIFENKNEKVVLSYIGSKRPILDFIVSTVWNTGGGNANLSFCDLFGGTHIVGKTFKELGYDVISNDLMSYSYAIGKHLIENNEKTIELNEKIKALVSELNSLSGIHGIISENFCPIGKAGRMFFTNENGMLCDAMRQKIEYWKDSEVLTQNEYFWFLSSLISNIDQLANTASVYGAYLKKFKPSAIKPLKFSLLPIAKGPLGRVYQRNANELIKEMSGDILYLDPPYNNRQYPQNYHVLETIALYDNHPHTGISGQRSEPNKKSDYCKKSTAENALSDILANAKFKHIYMSYSTEGIMSVEAIHTLFEKHFGKCFIFERNHKKFKSNMQEVLIKEPLKELIFYGNKDC